MASKSTCRDCGVIFYFIQKGHPRTRCASCRRKAKLAAVGTYFSKERA